MIVTSHINQHNWVPTPPPPPPFFVVYPHEMQQAKHMKQFNSYNPSHQMGGLKVFNGGHHRNELNLVVKLFIHNMPHQMGGYGFSNDWSHHNEHKKYTRWMEEEHRSFLHGLEICGEGNWKKTFQRILFHQNSESNYKSC